MSASAIPAPTPVELWEELQWAKDEGSDREFVMAMRDFLLDASLRHTAADGCPISERQARVIANNLAMGLADLARGLR